MRSLMRFVSFFLLLNLHKFQIFFRIKSFFFFQIWTRNWKFHAWALSDRTHKKLNINCIRNQPLHSLLYLPDRAKLAGCVCSMWAERLDVEREKKKVACLYFSFFFFFYFGRSTFIQCSNSIEQLKLILPQREGPEGEWERQSAAKYALFHLLRGIKSGIMSQNVKFKKFLKSYLHTSWTYLQPPWNFRNCKQITF